MAESPSTCDEDLETVAILNKQYSPATSLHLQNLNESRKCENLETNTTGTKRRITRSMCKSDLENSWKISSSFGISESPYHKKRPISKKLPCDNLELTTGTSKNMLNHISESHISPQNPNFKEDEIQLQIFPSSNKILKNTSTSHEDQRSKDALEKSINKHLGEETIEKEEPDMPTNDGLDKMMVEESQNVGHDSLEKFGKEKSDGILPNILHPSEKSDEINSSVKNIGSRGNKLDEILRRTKDEKYQRHLRWGSQRGNSQHGRGQQAIPGDLVSTSKSPKDQSNFLSDIIAAQAKTSQIGKNEHHQNSMSVRDQIYKYEGQSYLYAEFGDAGKDYKQPAEGNNINYAMWTLKRKEDPSLKQTVEPKQPSKENSLSVLIRSSIHGIRLEYDKVSVIYSSLGSLNSFSVIFIL